MMNCPFCDFQANVDDIGKHVAQNHAINIVKAWPEDVKKRYQDNRITTVTFTVQHGVSSVKFCVCLTCQQCVRDATCYKACEFANQHVQCAKDFDAIAHVFAYDESLAALRSAERQKQTTKATVGSTGPPRIKCQYCDYTGGGERYKVNRHQATCKLNPANAPVAKPVTTHRCAECGYETVHAYHLKRHMMTCRKRQDHAPSPIEVEPRTATCDTVALHQLQEARDELSKLRKANDKLTRDYDNLDEAHEEQEGELLRLEADNAKMRSMCERMWTEIVKADPETVQLIRNVFGITTVRELEGIVDSS